MSKTDWGDATWNANGELVVNIHKELPKETKGNKGPKHTYAEVDCGGECGGCVGLIVDGEVVDGPPFHKNCKCSMDGDDIDNAEVHESNLDDEVGPNRNSKPDDVRWLKESLHELGFYEPDTRAGETEENMNEYPNQNLFDGINKFQREHNLKERGSVKPGHWTEAKLNNELKKQTKRPAEKYEYKGSTFNSPLKNKEGQYALFDGKSLAVYQGDEKLFQLDAVSGKKGFQTPEYQNLKAQGPLPEGVYVARHKDFQRMNAYGAVAGIANKGTWPGSYYSWGNSRAWLEPSNETNTYGRDRFTIHGGMYPGSAGCIDLTGQMNAFGSWFENSGKDLVLYVKY